MKAVAADMIFCVITIRDRVGIGIVRHGLVESRVEDGHLGHTGQKAGADIYPHQVRRIMKGREFLGSLEGLPYRGIDGNRGAEMFASVDHAVSDTADFAHIRQNSPLAIYEKGQQGMHRIAYADRGAVLYDIPR